MQMDAINLLPVVMVAVENRAAALFGKPLLSGNLLGNQKNLAYQRGILGLDFVSMDITVRNIKKSEI